MPTNKLKITPNSNGTYKISFWEKPGICVENPANQTGNGTQVQLNTCGSSVWQQWYIDVDQPTGAAFFKNAGSGNCIEDGGNTNAGNIREDVGTATPAT